MPAITDCAKKGESSRFFRAISLVFPGLAVIVVLCPAAAGQSSTGSTETQVEPEADFHLQLPSGWRVIAFTGLVQGAGFPYQQWYGAAALGYQFKPILRPHLENIDPDKEHYLVFGGGYEYLRTTESGKMTHDNRLALPNAVKPKPTA